MGAMHPDLSPSLLNLGDALLEPPEYGRALAAIQRAVALRERSGGPDSVDYARALDHLGTAMIGAGRYDDALRVLERSLRVKESTLEGITDVGVARTLEAIGLALQRKGDYGQAGIRIRRAAVIQEEADVAHPAYAETLTLLGLQLWFEGNLLEAREISARAVAVAERTLRADHPTVARSLRYLAGPVLDLGDLTQARSLLGRALAIAERSLGPSHHETGALLNDLAGANLLLGAYPSARALFERSLRIAEARFGPWHDRVATAVYNLAFVDASLGDYASARRQQARATAIWERAFGLNHPFVAVALMELAAVFREQGSAADALPILERALAIRERSLGATHRDVARTLADLAATLAQVGHPKRAQDFAARALRIWEGVDAPEAIDRATVLALYAELQANGGDATAARQYYDRALAIREKVFGASHPTVAETQVGLASTLANLGDGISALKIAASAEATGRDHLRLMLRYLPERQSLHYATSRPKGLDLILSLVGSAPEAHAIAIDGLIRSRALVLDEIAARSSAGRTSADAASLLAELTAARQRLANLVVRGPGQVAPARYAALIENARHESELAERTLAERSAAFRAELRQAQVGLNQVSASLPAGGALVSFVRYERTPVDGSSRKARSDLPSRPPARTVTSYLAFVLRPNQQPVAIALASAVSIDALVARWRADIATEVLGPTKPPDGVRPSSRSSGTELRKLVWDPLPPHLGDAGRVFIVPDGALSLVNFAALPVGSSEYLIERRPIMHYLPTERDLVVTSETSPPSTGLLAFGGPAFDAKATYQRAPKATVRSISSPCGTLQSLVFQGLPGTLREATEVVGLWKSGGASSDSGDVHFFGGSEATERAFKKQAPGRRVLHLATHGFFLGGACDPSAPGTRAVGRVTAAGPASSPATAAQNPLLVSGLAFAGANQRAKAGPKDEDGILTAEEISAMNLLGTEWAVLSACDTGLGEIKAGEGVFGLRRAFQIAGVRTVIMSLWSVEDQATRAWMRALYEARLNDRLDTAESVRAASLHVLRDRRAKGLSTHPFYWAAFVAAGDWR